LEEVALEEVVLEKVVEEVVLLKRFTLASVRL